MSTDLLNKKKSEHGDWKHNSESFEKLFFAAKRSHVESGGDSVCEFEFRPDFSEIVAILQKLSRLLTKHGKNNPDDWLDIAGYATLRYNELDNNRSPIKLRR